VCNLDTVARVFGFVLNPGWQSAWWAVLGPCIRGMARTVAAQRFKSDGQLGLAGVVAARDRGGARLRRTSMARQRRMCRSSSRNQAGSGCEMHGGRHLGGGTPPVDPRRRGVGARALLRVGFEKSLLALSITSSDTISI
jgi:hypothetical protein